MRYKIASTKETRYKFATLLPDGTLSFAYRGYTTFGNREQAEKAIENSVKKYGILMRTEDFIIQPEESES